MHISSWSTGKIRPFPGKLTLLATFLGAGLLLCVIIGYRFINAAWYSTPKEGAENVTISVVEGERFFGVAESLHEADIANALLLRLYVRLFDDATIYPGNYVVAKGMSYRAIMTELHSNDVDSTRVTIAEGYSLEKMGIRIHEKFPHISVDDWAAATSAKSTLATDPFIIASKKPAGVDLEGYLFPDTYEFALDATAEDIAETMLRTMETRIGSIGDVSGDAEGMTMHELLTLASIVEKEVRTPETMKNVADIFLKRLEIGMALQSDATINYIIDGDNPSPLYSDLEVESPYNTYKNPGLPPGPISSPGLNALSAVIHPTHNDYYYFLTTDEGDIYYAETYEEHLRNKGKWLK